MKLTRPAEPQGSKPLIAKPAIGYDPEPVPPTPIITTNLTEVHLNVTLPSPSWSSKWRFPRTFPYQNSVRMNCVAYRKHAKFLLRNLEGKTVGRRRYRWIYNIGIYVELDQDGVSVNILFP
jgi:hypothetical protein